MTRSTPLTQTVAAKRKVRTAARALPDPTSMKLLVFEDNGGAYHWTIVADRGERLVRSASFASYEDAKHAARALHAGLASASFEQLAGDTPTVNVVAGRHTGVVRDDLDAERWLDEGGGFSSEAIPQ